MIAFSSQFSFLDTVMRSVLYFTCMTRSRTVSCCN